MKRFSTANPLLYTLGVVFIFVLWFLISLSQGQGNLIFPGPVETFQRLGELLSSAYIWQSIGMSLLRSLEGFAISFGFALVLGSIAGEFKPLQPFFRPLILVLKSAPTAAFVFFFLFISGSTNAPIWIVVLLAFPILYEAVVSGINAVPKQLIWASQVDQASRLKAILTIKVPLATPFILLGLVNSFALSFKTEIMAEIVTGSTNPGLGGAIRSYRNLDPSDLTPIFAIAFIAIVLVLLFDLASFGVKKALAKQIEI